MTVMGRALTVLAFPIFAWLGASVQKTPVDYSCFTNGAWVSGDAWVAFERIRGTVGCSARELESVSAGISRIAMTRWGGDASYSVVLDRDGSATFDGYCNITPLGCHKGRMSGWRFDRLARLVTEIGYFDLASSYESDVTDQQFVVLAITQFGCEKPVLDYGGEGPSRLWALEEMIAAELPAIEIEEDHDTR